MAIGAGVCTALFSYTLWLENGTLRRAIFFGVGLALAILSKFSAFLVLPVCLAVITLLYPRLPHKRNWAWIPVAFLLVWGAYRFSFGPMTEHVSRDSAEQGGLIGKIPAPVLHALETLPVPAPQLLDGLWQVHNHVDAGHTAFLLGRHSFHGWWYFFPVALGVKTPIPVLLLAMLGIWALRGEKRRERWMPAILCGVILLINLPTSLNIGVRYMLPLFPLLALTAGGGAVWLWARRPIVAGVAMAWIFLLCTAAYPNYLAYFNEIAGAHPERILVDSDLDWGQDMKRLAGELRLRGVSYFHMSCLYTGDDTRLGLPAWDSLEPYQPVKGWVAVSQTMLQNYGWMVAQQKGRSDLAFAWLDVYQPVARVGKSILLYHIP